MANRAEDAAAFWAERLGSLRDVLNVDERRRVLHGYDIESMASTPMTALFGLFERTSALSHEVRGRVAEAVWNILVEYVAGFSIERVSPLRAEEIVNVFSACISELASKKADEVVANIWKREADSALRWQGLNVVIRIAAGVFPQTASPLLRLLTVLTIDRTSAELACELLYGGLESLTEMSTGYTHLLIGVEREARALQFMRAVRNKSYEKVLSLTKPSEGTAVFIQARSSIPKSSYRPEIPEATFGTGCEETGLVTWAISWNGWEALFEIIKVFVLQLRQYAVPARFSQIDLDNFLSTAGILLEFLTTVCLHSSEAVRSAIAEEHKVLPIVTELFVELANYDSSSQLSWLTRSVREQYLEKTGTCLSALALCDVYRSQYVLDHITAERGSTVPLRNVLSSLGPSCFPAVSALATIAASYQLETHLSNGVDISQIVGKARGKEIVDPRFMPTMLTVLSESALPVWNSTTPSRRTDSAGTYDWWDFPSDVLTFMRSSPEFSINSIPVAKTVAKVIAKATSSSVENGNPSGLYSIVCSVISSLHVIVDCLKYVQSKLSSGELKNKELSFLQSALLTPETLTGLGLLSSGCAPLLSETVLSEAKKTQTMRTYALLFENEYAMLDYRQMTASALKQHIEDSATDCLSHLFRTLHMNRSENDVVQAPWPSIDLRRPVGRTIREGFAKRLRETGSISCAEFLITAIICGQRGTCRSLLDPFPAKKILDVNRSLHANGANTPAGETPAASSEPDTCILSSIVKFIRDGLKKWTSVMVIPDDAQDPSREDKIECSEIVRILSKYVRFLTVLWESQNHFWFVDFWESESIWTLLAGILKCEGRSNAGAFDLAYAVGSKEIDLVDEHEIPELLEQRTDQSVVFTHAESFWRRTASDVLSLFASEILVCAGKASKTVSHIAADEESRAEAKKLREELFAGPQFLAFGEAFTERWIHVLLQPDYWLMFPRVDFVEQGSMVLEASHGVHSSLESTTGKFAAELASTLGLPKSAGMELLNTVRTNTPDDNLGKNYKYDVGMVWSLLKRSNVADSHCQVICADLMYLNSMWARADVQLTLTKAFAAMTYSVVFADAFAPLPGKALSYASPQYCGKLCRCLARFLVSLRTPSHFPGRLLDVQLEMVQLISFLSARLTEEELQQPALTAVRFISDLDEEMNYGLRKSPLGQLCFVVDLLLPSTREGFASPEEQKVTVEIVKSLFIAASYLNRGVAFRMDEDLESLEVTCFDALRMLRKNSAIAQSSATAIMSMQSCTTERLQPLFVNRNAAQCVFETITSLQHASTGSDESEVSAAVGTSSLLLMLAQLLTWLDDGNEEKGKAVQLSLRNLSGGSLSALFPRGPSEIVAYDLATLSRRPLHMAWCACLALACVSMEYVRHPGLEVTVKEQLEQDIVDFAATNLDRICLASLNLYGDWPPQSSDDFAGPQHITIARVEEAEIAAQTLFQLSFHAVGLVHKLPDHIRQTIIELLKFVRHIHKILRHEPIERSVKPVSEQEKFRSEFTRGGKDLPATAVLVPGSSPWVHSPQTPSAHSSPPLRSPRQSIVAVVSGGSGGRTPGSFRPSPLASPGMPQTPQFDSPIANNRGPSTLSPLSPWTPHGAGLISEGGLMFGEECTRSLLRGLNMALGALRNLCRSFHAPFVEPGMKRSEGYLDFHTLIGLMYYCMTEISRGAYGEQRDLYTFITENLLHMAVTHLAIYEERGKLETGFRNEVANKLNTVVTRLRKAVPPIHQMSIIHTAEIDEFIRGLQQLL